MAAQIDPYDALLKEVTGSFSANKGLAIVAQNSFAMSRCWLSKFILEYQGNPATRLAIASQSASVEVVSAISLGLARPAVFSLRSHFELFLMFLYYKDHSRELTAADNDVEFMKLPGEVGKYLRKYYKFYEKRWAILDLKKTRPKADGYGRLSEIVHGSSQTAAPNASTPINVCMSDAEMLPLVSLIGDISEELCDVATSAHEGNWISLPEQVKTSLLARGASSLQGA